MQRVNEDLAIPLTVEKVQRLRECETVFFSRTEEHGLSRVQLHELLEAWTRFDRLLTACAPRFARPECPCPDCAAAREVERRKEAQDAIEEQLRAAAEGRV